MPPRSLRRSWGGVTGISTGSSTGIWYLLSCPWFWENGRTAGLCEEGARPGRDRQASAVNTATLSLTHREREVAELVALGLTNRQIAAKLFISERTAEFHVEQIRNKLGFHTRSQIAAWMALDQPRPRPIDAAPFSALPDDSTKRQRLRPSLRLAVLGLAAATVLAASGLVAVSLRSHAPVPASPTRGRVLQVDAGSGQPTRWSSPLSTRASTLAVGMGGMWSVSYEDKVLTRIDPKTAAVLGSYGVPAPPVGITVGGGLVWIAAAFGDTALEPFDPKTNQFGQPVSLGSGVAPQGIAYGWNSIWVTDKNKDLVYRVDPSTSMVTNRIAVGDGPEAIAVDASGVWVANGVEGTVSRIDPQSSRVVATIGLREAPTAIAAGPSGVWVVSESADLVVRIDPVTNQPLEIPIDAHPTEVSVTRNDVWVAEGPAGRILRIDQRSNRVMSSIAVGGRVDALSADDQSVWIAVHGS